MKRPFICIASMFLCALALSSNIASAQTQSSTSSQDETKAGEIHLTNPLAQLRPQKRPAFSLIPSNYAASVKGPLFSFRMTDGTSQTVFGTGAVGRLTKWTGFTSGRAFIGDSTIFESNSGLVGIGTDTPTSRLTVAGTIESTSGGLKFPDGTVQTTSASGALSTVAHDATLTGNGTVASPLSVVQSDPANQAFQIELPGANTGFTVPAGKRLVIEYVAGFYAVPTSVSQQPLDSIVIRTQIGSAVIGHIVLSNRVSIDSTGFSVYHLGQSVRLYADPGTQVSAVGFASNTGTASVTFSGHFVNVP